MAGNAPAPPTNPGLARLERSSMMTNLPEQRIMAARRAALKCEDHKGVVAGVVDTASIAAEWIPGISVIGGAAGAVVGAGVGIAQGTETGVVAANFGVNAATAAAGLSPIPGTGVAVREAIHQGATAAGVSGKYAPGSATGDMIRRQQLCP